MERDARRKDSKLRSFEEIHAIAAERKGGTNALEALLTKPKPAADVAQVPEDRWLAGFSRAIFQTGISWKVVDNKWDGIEAAFKGFDVGACAMMDDDWFDELLTDTRIIRHGAKVQSVRDNAAFLLSLRDQGGAGRVFADWPATDYAGLLALLKTEGSRLGASTGQYAMRLQGRDGYMMSTDVVARLSAEGVIDKSPSSKRAMTAVQDAFNIWMDQSGRSLTEISRVLAFSV